MMNATYAVPEATVKEREQIEIQHSPAVMEACRIVENKLKENEEEWVKIPLNNIAQEFSQRMFKEKHEKIFSGTRIEMRYTLCSNPNIVSKRSRLYKWTTPEKKNKLRFSAIGYINIKEDDIAILERAYKDEQVIKNINDLLCVYDYLVKNGAKMYWKRINAMLLAAQRAVPIRKIFNALKSLEDHQVLIGHIVKNDKGKDVYVCHLARSKEHYDALTNEMAAGFANYMEDDIPSRHARAEKIMQSAEETQVASINHKRENIKAALASGLFIDRREDVEREKNRTDGLDMCSESSILNSNELNESLRNLQEIFFSRQIALIQSAMYVNTKAKKASEAELAELKKKFARTAQENYDLCDKTKKLEKENKTLDKFIKGYSKHVVEELMAMQGELMTVIMQLGNIDRMLWGNPRIVNKIKGQIISTVSHAVDRINNYSPDYLLEKK